MLHLNVVRADAACATHEMSAGQDAPTQHDMGGVHEGHDSSPADGAADAADCKTPAQEDCCEALASCSLVLGADDAAVAAPTALPHLGVLTAPADMPLSRVAAPEPPPPKV
jgi:hypothetical protein